MKKLLGIVVLGLSLSLVTSQAISAGCKVPKKPKEKIIEAPEAVLKKQKISTNIIEKVLAKRRTINVFKAWNGSINDTKEKPYGLIWDGQSFGQFSTGKINKTLVDAGYMDTIFLLEQYWAYFRDTNNINKTSKYYTDFRFVFGEYEIKSMEYGYTRKLNYHHPDFLNLLTARTLAMKEAGYHGVMLDLWKNQHPNDRKPYFKPWPPSKKKQKKVQEGRLKIAKAIREKMGDDFIILGNVNYEKDKSIHAYMNGVFLEFHKKTKRYPCKKISEMEEVIKFHDQHLSEPRIIAVNPWRVTKKFSGSKWDKFPLIEKDRSSPENIQFAKLFTAMAMVIPENGYIMYGDNNWDFTTSEHMHTYYDFYNTDLGKATSHGMEITEGLGYKKYEKGLIAYNRTKFKYIIKFKDGKKVEIGPLEGVFVKG